MHEQVARVLRTAKHEDHVTRQNAHSRCRRTRGKRHLTSLGLATVYVSSIPLMAVWCAAVVASLYMVSANAAPVAASQAETFDNNVAACAQATAAVAAPTPTATDAESKARAPSGRRVGAVKERHIAGKRARTTRAGATERAAR